MPALASESGSTGYRIMRDTYGSSSCTILHFGSVFVKKIIMTWCNVSYVTVHMKLYYNDLIPSKDLLLFF